MPDLILATSIRLDRAEGLTDECYNVLLEIGKSPQVQATTCCPNPSPYMTAFGIIRDADDLWLMTQLVFAHWGQTAPSKHRGGYDKCDFKITWADGESYTGRYDLQQGGKNDCGEDLAGQVRSMLRHWGNITRPAWADDANWEAVQQANRERNLVDSSRAFLRTYAIGAFAQPDALAAA